MKELAYGLIEICTIFHGDCQCQHRGGEYEACAIHASPPRIVCVDFVSFPETTTGKRARFGRDRPVQELDVG